MKIELNREFVKHTLYVMATEVSQEYNRAHNCWISQSRAILNGFNIAVVYNVHFANSLV